MPERNVLPKPYVKPHPPMWVAAGNPGTFEKAGKMGLGVLCFTGGSPDEDGAARSRSTRSAIADAEPVGEFVNDNIAVTTSFMCLEDRDEARRLDDAVRQRPPADAACSTTSTRSRSRRSCPSGRPRSRTRRSSRSRRAVESGASIVGTPDDCAEALQKWDDIGVDQLIMGPSGSTYSHELLQHTVELFGDEVIPRFDKDPEHSTSRYRAAAAAKLAGV